MVRGISIRNRRARNDCRARSLVKVPFVNRTRVSTYVVARILTPIEPGSHVVILAHLIACSTDDQDYGIAFFIGPA